ncbi:hypothetical protein K7X08_009858 [Anisodus acutangulus]|uniref:Uncharacterized protein n=1 Tax=Anisodus acutangulus TaxID=402998 RepID=A0A9Q1N023_9SOLA|nr:hypothetical protein K7X08_009858 [Anisodus acutangulus]
MNDKVREKKVLKSPSRSAKDLSYEEDTQHASKAPSKLEEEDTQSEDFGDIGTSRSGKSVQVPTPAAKFEFFYRAKFGIIKAPTPATEVNVPRLTTQVEKPTDVPEPTVKVEVKDVPAQVDENVVPTGEVEKVKDDPAKFVENASKWSQVDV